MVFTELEKRLATVAQFSPEIGWVKDAIKAGYLKQFVVLSTGNVLAIFVADTWEDGVVLPSRFVGLSLKDIEREFSRLATQAVKAENRRKQLRKQEDLAYYKNMYKQLKRNEKLSNASPDVSVR